MQSSGQFCFWFLLFILNYCWLLAVYQLVTSVSLCRDQPSSLSAGSFPQFTTRNPSYIIHLTPEAVLSTRFPTKAGKCFLILKSCLRADTPDWKLFMSSNNCQAAGQVLTLK